MDWPGLPHFPQWESSPTLGPLAQAFVSRGYAFLAPNVRGSRGYGRHFREANLDDWGGRTSMTSLPLPGGSRPRESQMADVSASTARPAAGTSRSSPSVARRGDGRPGRARTASSPSRAFIDTPGPEMRGTLEAWIGSPEANPSLYRERSPSTYVGQIRVPVLILESGRDARLPAVDTKPFLDALRARRVAVAHHSYSNEGHDFHHPANRADASARLLAFFDEHLVDRGSSV